MAHDEQTDPVLAVLEAAGRRTRRIFVPATRYVGQSSVPTRIRQWEWRRGHGIRVTYLDGLTCRSDYRSLRELFAGETVREVEP